jgi:ribosomal protein S13
VYFIILLALGFIAYKSPSVIGFLLYDQPHISISLFALSVLGFSLANYMLEKRAIKSEGQVKSLKDKLKDAKRMLISQMDPTLVEAVKEIIRGDMQDEINRMRDSEKGCSQKCKLSIDMHKMDVERNELLVKELIEFKWCDQCKQG